MIGARVRHAVAAFGHHLTVRRGPWRERILWCLDLETGGLDPRTDPILSVGMVPIREGVIALGESYRALVRPARPVSPSSLTVHHILPRDLDNAPPLATLLPTLRSRLDRAVLVVHQRRVDVPFLRWAFRAHGIDPPVFAVIDTVQLLFRYARRHGHLTPEQTEFPMGLAEARAWFGLPPHRSHEALSDAVATGELFLVLAHRLDGRRLAALL
jgi:DNA polymerase-3 subunit epsilon